MWPCACTGRKTVCNLVNGNLVYLLFMTRFIPVTLGEFFNLFTADDFLFDFILHFFMTIYEKTMWSMILSIEIN